MKLNLKYISLASMLMFTGNVYAALESWQLTATVSHYSDFNSPSFMPPSFLALGSTITIDFVIDNTVALNAAGYFSNAIVSATFNGETSLPLNSRIINGGGGEIGMNISLPTRQNDLTNGIWLIHYAALAQPTVDLALAEISDFIVPQPNSTSLSLNFGSEMYPNDNANNVFARPISLTEVPAPAAAWLFGSGLFG